MPSFPFTPLSPSLSLMQTLRHELMRHAPFAQMTPAHVDRFIACSRQAYFAPGETILSPASGIVETLYCIRRGSVTGRRDQADSESDGHQYVTGDLFPVGAVTGHRPVTALYIANEDTFCLLLAAIDAKTLSQESPPFAEFLSRRVMQLLTLSQRTMQMAYASQALATQSLEALLGSLPRKHPVQCTPDTPLSQALATMHEHHLGSILVQSADGVPQGILTRHDVLDRITLAQVPLDAPIAQVMSTPLHSLTVDRSTQDAMLMMSRHGIRHVPVTERGRVVNIVSERDLFTMQRLSLKHVGTTIRAARDISTLQAAAQNIRHLAQKLLGQGVGAQPLGELISHLNDLLTSRLIGMLAYAHHIDLQRMCWLAFGSEGRGEQTLATDQDNGLIFVSDDPSRDRPHWLAFARHVNEALDICGYPLCKGNVMASNPACCLTAAEWCTRFQHWLVQGTPEDLLNANIYFDLRPIAGNQSLSDPLRQEIRQAPNMPRFIQLLAENALRNRVPLTWRGTIRTRSVQGRQMLDLKMHASALFVDAARLYALAQGVKETNTRRRFEAVAPALKAETNEAQAWATGFEYLQMLRLRTQVDHGGANANPNLIEISGLNDIDRRVLREALRVARRLRQRIELDYPRL